MIQRLVCRVTGRVQMVMFRDFVCRKARKLGITGTVENEDDGTVSVVAEGEAQDLQKLLEEIRKGSPLARVDEVEESWEKPKGEFDSFNIVY